MVDSLMSLIEVACGQGGTITDEAVRGRLARVSARLPIGSREWWSLSRWGIVETIVSTVTDECDGSEDCEAFLRRQRPTLGGYFEGTLLESLWRKTLLGLLSEVPEVQVTDCLVESMTSGAYWLVWAEDPQLGAVAVERRVSTEARSLRRALAVGGEPNPRR